MRPVRLGSATCLHAREIRLDFDAGKVELDGAIDIVDDEALNVFAIRDGFRPPARFADQVSPWEYMAKFWRLTHPDSPVFGGMLIDWDDTFAAVTP